MNPYLVLGVPRDADDARIRQAYLDAVKQTPPDTHPERFQAVSEAYETIQDEPCRMRYYLFHRDCPGDSPLDAFARFYRAHGALRPLPFEAMKELLRACAKT